MCELVAPILEVIKFIGHPARKYLNYRRKFNEYMDGLKQAQADLQDRKGDIQQQLQDEHRFGKKPKQEVETWLKKVEEKLDHAQRVEAKLDKGKYLFRFCLGKLLDETTQALKEIHAESHSSGSLVVNDPSTKAVKLPTPKLVGETNVREEIYQFLMGDEVQMIGVCGMGGIGKTTIMKDVYNRLMKETKFSKLIWATASRDFDIRSIQKDIASQLKENLSDHENTIIRAATLSEMLRKEGRYVLILDDVWTTFQLEDVGILEPTTNNGCKLVLTTRSEEVVRSMGCKKVQVACLSMDEAMHLFLSKVRQDILPNPTLESFMKLIVGECDGLPLAIVTLAGCMRGISDPHVWENAVHELRGYIRNMRDMEDKVYGCLKFSYDRLAKIDQECFLYCALYPEDYEIEKEEIIEHWMEEGLIDEMGSRKAMEDSGHSILLKLEQNCLLERVGEGTHTKMHDVVRDMALHITRKRFLAKLGMQLKELPNEEEWSEDLEKVSLKYNSISAIPQHMKCPKFQKLTTLLLSRNSLKEIPESFFEHIPNLKILDLSGNPIMYLPNSVSSLEKLTALLLRGCYRLKSLPSLLKVQELKKLDLGNTSIREIPQGLEMLVNLRYLNLGRTWWLEEIPNGLLSKLCRLQYLAIHPASTKPEELRELNKLEVFEGCFSNVGDLSMYAGQRKMLCKYSILVCPKFNDCSVYSCDGYSKMVTFGRFEINSGDAIILPYDIQQLHLDDCKGVRSLNDIGLRNAIDLKRCKLENCVELESVFSSSCLVLQKLESLKLERLKNLKVIVGVGESSVGTFSSLKEIILWKCGQIKHMLSANWVLHNLEEIRVGYCEKMEEIIESVGTNTIKFTLPRLKRLNLWGLPELKGIVSKHGVMVCDSLQLIEINDCQKLKRIPLYLPLLDFHKGTPSSLKEILVYPTEWWESVEWINPNANANAKIVLQPLLKFWDVKTREWKQAA